MKTLEKWQSLIADAERVIIENIDLITATYYDHKNRAGYNWRVAGLNATYDRLNSLLPDNFRDNLNIQEAMLVNSAIKGLLARRKELN